MSQELIKHLVLIILVIAALSLSAWAGILTQQHWEWLDTNRIAGLAILEVLFTAVSALGAIAVTNHQWDTETPAGLARIYLITFGKMVAVFAGVGILLLLAGWALVFLRSSIGWLFDRYPWLMIGGLAGGFLIVYWIADRRSKS
ncbi:hypothetical protein IQ266_02255 [filamentous cyanobacterium LEGE 11480]|uniref:Uncharacterized protein n=1 Tax=Romeriopsis navalis LEGE 11480 TaxID=2777977 RepID=A0A928Z1J9_9CYAN|nr:hypothetical protein [Romeriopsis navalis]MBE9028579.1 hypothetical protein [Romeriopsis navalis LEGE 11480]